MNKFFAQLRPMERRLAVAVLVILILVLNWLFIWPHFSDWSKLNARLDNARRKLALYHTTIAETSKYESLVKGYEGQGQFIPPEDQSFSFLRTIRDQAAVSGVQISNYGRQSIKTNEFFNEQSQSISVQADDAQLVDFLYKLGEGASMVRVRDLDIQPDQPHLHLNANIELVASYQKKPLSAATATAPAAATAAKTSSVVTVPQRRLIAETNSQPATVKSK
jgi:type II secretory pathway component PulM